MLLLEGDEKIPFKKTRSFEEGSRITIFLLKRGAG
jgi:hypothetical protein